MEGNPDATWLTPTEHAKEVFQQTDFSDKRGGLKNVEGVAFAELSLTKYLNGYASVSRETMRSG